MSWIQRNNERDYDATRRVTPAGLAHFDARDRRRGVVLVMVAICLVVIAGMLGLVIDGGRAANAYRELQASSDAAATAGAQALPDETAAKVMALEFSAVAGKKNARPDLPGVSMSPGYPLTKCLTSTGLPCNPSNAIVVKQQADMPSLFAWVLGTASVRVSATATASMQGGTGRPMDIMVIVDVSTSMASSCTATGTGVSSPKRVDCAKAGIRTFLNEMWPCSSNQGNCGTATNGNIANPVAAVGLGIFPGLELASAIPKERDCNGTNILSGDVAPYTSSPVYTVVPLSSDYKTSNTSTLNGAGSKLVKAVDWGHGNTCSANGYGSASGYGIEARGGVGSQFAGAISKAHQQLVQTGRLGIQKVIILISDGDANGVTNACKKAIDQAHAAAASGTWVYAIAYGASNSSSTCPDDNSSLTGVTTMQGIASSSDKYFSQPSAADLSAIFKQIAGQLTTTRLLNDNRL